MTSQTGQQIHILLNTSRSKGNQENKYTYYTISHEVKAMRPCQYELIVLY